MIFFFLAKEAFINMKNFISAHLVIHDNFMLGFVYTICGTSTAGLMMISSLSTKEAIQTLSASFALIPAMGMCFLFLVNRFSELKAAIRKVKNGIIVMINSCFDTNIKKACFKITLIFAIALFIYLLILINKSWDY